MNSELFNKTSHIRKFYKFEVILGFSAIVWAPFLFIFGYIWGEESGVAAAYVFVVINFFVVAVWSIVESIRYFCLLLRVEDEDLSKGEKDTLKQLRTISIISAITSPFPLVDLISKCVFLSASKTILKNKA